MCFVGVALMRSRVNEKTECFCLNRTRLQAPCTFSHLTHHHWHSDSCMAHISHQCVFRCMCVSLRPLCWIHFFVVCVVASGSMKLSENQLWPRENVFSRLKLKQRFTLMIIKGLLASLYIYLLLNCPCVFKAIRESPWQQQFSSLPVFMNNSWSKQATQSSSLYCGN